MLYARVRYQSGGHDVQININVIAEHTRCRNSQRSVFIGLIHIIHRNYLVFIISHSNSNCSNIAIQLAIIGLVCKGIRAEKVSIRGVGEGSVRIQHQGTVCRFLFHDRGQNSRVKVNIICQHTGSSDGQRRIFIS